MRCIDADPKFWSSDLVYLRRVFDFGLPADPDPGFD